MSQSFAAERAPAGRKLTGRHVLFAFLAFFGVIIAVNVVMVYSALSTFNGIETPDAYRKGLAYNQTLAEEASQASLGWSGKLELSADRKLRLTLTDKAGQPVPGLAVSAKLGRPATDREDEALQLAEVSPGLYEAAAGKVAAGNWVVALEAGSPASGDQSVVFRMKERLYLKP